MNDKLKFSAINYDFLFEEEIKERDNLLFHEANSPNKWRGWVDSIDENNINCKIVRIYEATKPLVIYKSILSADVINDLKVGFNFTYNSKSGEIFYTRSNKEKVSVMIQK
jgi:hypothetical protein